jgi:exodeoxyribonuclease-3
MKIPSLFQPFRCKLKTPQSQLGRSESVPLDRWIASDSIRLMGGARWKAAVLAAAMVVGLGSAMTPTALAAAPQVVKVLSLNVRLDSEAGADKIADLIRKSRADIVGLQESSQKTEAIAKHLGYQWQQQGEGTAVLTRYQIVGTTPKKHGVEVQLPDGHKLMVFNLHLHHIPYQPYQLLNIPYGDHPFVSSEEEAVEQAQAARGHEVQEAISEIREVQGPLVVTGDFNEPSHLDWTERAVRAKRHPIAVAWPTSQAMQQEGLKDSFRELYPDEVTHPGFTWNPLTNPADANDHHDRLDFVLYRGEGLKPVAVDIVAEKESAGSIVVNPYPTDHRGVLTCFEWNR